MIWHKVIEVAILVTVVERKFHWGNLSQSPGRDKGVSQDRFGGQHSRRKKRPSGNSLPWNGKEATVSETCVWGHGSSVGLIRTWAFAWMRESYWRFRAELVTVWDLSFTGSPPQAAELRLE